MDIRVSKISNRVSNRHLDTPLAKDLVGSGTALPRGSVNSVSAGKHNSGFSPFSVG